MRLVVDASVVAKWFNNEELSDKATELKDAYVDGRLELAAPIQIIYEVGNTIWKNPQLTEKDSAEAITSLLQMDLQLLPPNLQRVSRAMELARSNGITFYDASYLQAAEELKTTLLSTDDKQIAAGKGTIKILHLREVKL